MKPKRKYKSKKQFILSHGATCKNWTWSWGYVNHEKKIVIQGCWRSNGLILDEEWGKASGTKGASKNELLGYYNLVDHWEDGTFLEKKGYKLYIFEQIEGSDGGKPSVKDFKEELIEKKLVRIDNEWFAEDID